MKSSSIQYAGKFFFLIYFVQFSQHFITRAEETPYSVENSRVLKILAEAEAAKTASSTTPGSKVQRPLLQSPSSANVSDNEFKNILREVKILKLIIARMQQMNNLDEQVSKCIASIKRNNEYKSQQHWRNIIAELGPGPDQDHEDYDDDYDETSHFQSPHQNTNHVENEETTILRRIVIGSYEGLRSNILPIIHFINHTRIISGFQPLLQEMHDYDHIYLGNEVFLIARLIRLWCGTESSLYKELPSGIQYIDSYSVYLLNENNQGVLFYKPKKAACHGRHCTNHELFTFHHSVSDLSEAEKNKTIWTFLPTSTSDSISNTTISFNMRNEFIDDSNQTANQSSQHRFVNIDYEFKLSPDKKSTIVVSLVNGTDDAVRIRVQASYLVKRLIMGVKNAGGSNFVHLSILGTDDRFEKANDGNWVVRPVQKLDSEYLQDKRLWNKNVQCSI